MWKCEACGTQGIAGDLVGCPACGVARNAGGDGTASVQVPAADAELAAALAPVVPPAAPVAVVETSSSTAVATPPAAPGPLAVPPTEAAHADTAEAEASSTPDGAVPEGT